jgi:hypothetical protein
MAFAWPANDTASAILGRPTQQLSWRDSPLVFQFNQTTGKSQGQQPYTVSPPLPSLRVDTLSTPLFPCPIPNLETLSPLQWIDAEYSPCGVDISQATQFDQQTQVVAYPTTPLPYGSIPVEGSAGGLSFPLNVHTDSQFTMYDATFNRPVNITFQGMTCTSPRVVKKPVMHQYNTALEM